MEVNLENIIAIGASTGGKDTVLRLLRQIPTNTDFPPILIAQHLPPEQSLGYVRFMKKNTALNICEAEDGMLIENNLVIIANSEYQMLVKNKKGRAFVSLKDIGLYRGFCPSIDLLFESVSEVFSEKAIGVILTGCSDDGSRGLLKIKQGGGFTIGQDEKTSVVYKMPKAALDIGAVTIELPLNDISEMLIKLCIDKKSSDTKPRALVSV